MDCFLIKGIYPIRCGVFENWNLGIIYGTDYDGKPVRK